MLDDHVSNKPFTHYRKCYKLQNCERKPILPRVEAVKLYTSNKYRHFVFLCAVLCYFTPIQHFSLQAFSQQITASQLQYVPQQASSNGKRHLSASSQS